MKSTQLSFQIDERPSIAFHDFEAFNINRDPNSRLHENIPQASLFVE